MNLDFHLNHLLQVFTLLSDNIYFAKLSKCVFVVPRIHYLRHIISGNGVHVDPDKIKEILEWPIPTTISVLRGFLGLAGYY